MSDERSAYPRFIVPTWPGEPFVLIAERGKFEYGPFEAGDFAVSKDNALYYSDGASHPIQLRISLQVGDLESVTPAVLEGALIAVERFARLGDVIRTATIALLLPELLEPGEELVAVSTSSNGSSPFDIEIDRRVGCLRLTRWARVGDDRKGLLRDYAKLAAEPSQRRAELYVLGEWAEQLLRSGVRSDTALGHSSAATSLMTPFGDLSTPFQDFSDVPDERVSIIDIGPTLARLIGQGPGSASDSLLGRSDECRVERDKTLAAGVLDWLLARVGRLLVPVP